MNPLSSVMFATVDLSSILPLTAVVVCVGAMIMFLVKAAVILRVQADDALRPSTMTANHIIQVPRLKMTRVHIPFTFRLLDAGNDSFEEVRLAVSSQVKYTFQAFWAVSIREMHISLWRTWSVLQEQTRSSTIVNAMHCQRLATNVRLDLLTWYFFTQLLSVPFFQQLYLAAGDPAATDDTNAGQTSGSLSMAEPVACSDSTRPLLCTDSILQDCTGIEQLCVVCHYLPLSRALLPCRHTCICAVCFNKLDRCPMCRAAITSFFCIRSEDYIPPSTIEPKVNSKSKSAVHWLDALNDRLTDFLGFR
ncbi:uncharacterized protein LOC129761184 [Toxorhynchites rutilus septentrionalis]|uniref:uncharacterized protein LOC129761184 n=1 Tax=Toxorhynchites rutilus septentrionalis TaxID=329112 RepID=UPI002478818E|nr:uncharacterized protein LOC129761184 [Toxorhynchites rutilus septentrionalis]